MQGLQGQVFIHPFRNQITHYFRQLSVKNTIEKIKNEAHKYSSIPFWSWNDKLDEEELRNQLRNMKSLGMGGAFMHARAGLETEYLSDDWFD